MKPVEKGLQDKTAQTINQDSPKPNKGFLALIQSTLFIKDSQLSVLFLAMVKKEWFVAFITSPLSLVVRPLLGLSLLVLAALQLFRMITAPKKSFELWVMTLLGVSSILLSNVSVWGGVIAYATGLVFVAGPMFFLASLVAGLLMQVMLSGEQAYLAFMADRKSVDRMHHLQAFVQNILGGAQFAACIAAMVFTVFMPLTPIVSGVFAALAVSLIVSTMVWRLIPHEHKLEIKGIFGFNKPVIEKDNSLGTCPAVAPQTVTKPAPVEIAPVESKGNQFFNAAEQLKKESVVAQPVSAPTFL